MSSWNEFKQGKRKKKDVALFELNLEDNIFRLHNDLVSKKYRHEPYADFYVCDPKRRHIHKATICDRVLHQAVFRVLYPVFDTHFIYDSYSSRKKKGTHAGVLRLQNACRKITANWRLNAYTLKCDVRKFFDSVDHEILRSLIMKKVTDSDTLWLIDIILNSFEKEKGKGLPLGNVTSQLFGNIYLNELDQYAKHILKTKYYFRYCDDFVIVHKDKKFLEDITLKTKFFLKDKLLLDLHPQKVEIRKIRQGIDFLGYVGLPYTHIIRTKTRKRIFKKLEIAQKEFNLGIITKENFKGIINSYLGVLSHCKNKKDIVKVRRFMDKIPKK